MVVERSRASYLIDVLGMPKVEGSNPGVAVIFRDSGNGRIRTIRELIRELTRFSEI